MDEPIRPKTPIEAEWEKRLKDLRNVHAIQAHPANRNASEHMRGMFNGMELALAIMEDREPVYEGAA